MTVTSFNIYQQITSVRLVSIDNLDGIYYNGQLNNGVGSYLVSSSDGQLTIDGINVNIGDRVLLSGQTNSNENGIYVVDQTGDIVTPFLLKRSPDLQNTEQLKIGQYFSVGAGNSFAGALYIIIEPLPSVIGIDPIIFIESSSGGFGPFLRVDENLADVASKLGSYQNLGFGSGQRLSLSEPDFTPQYFLPNPCPNIVVVNLTTPGTYSLILPPMTGETAFNLNQGLVILNTGTETFGLFAFEGPFQPSVPPGGAYRYFLIDNGDGNFQWERTGVVFSVNGKTGDVELFGSSNGVYVANSGSNTTGDGSIINPYQTLSFAMSQITDASPTNLYSINLLTGSFSDTDLTLKSNVFIYGNSSNLTITNEITLDADWSGGGYGGIFDLNNANFIGGMNLDFEGAGAPAAAFFIKNVVSNVANSWQFKGTQSGFTTVLLDSIYSFSLQPTIFVFDCFGYINNSFVSEFRVFNSSPAQNNTFSANNINITNNLVVQADDNSNLNFYISNSKIGGDATYTSLSLGSSISISNSVVYSAAPIVSGEPTLLDIDLIGFAITPTGGATVNYVTTAISSWDGSNDPVDVNGGSGIILDGGTINAVVNTWDGLSTPAVDVTAGSGISITGGTIDSVVNTWDGSTTAVDVTAGPGMDITGGTISGVIKSWDGDTTPVDVLAGAGIDITGGVISTSGGPIPVLCAFSASLFPALSNATGDGTAVNVICSNVDYNISGSYDDTTGIFTAPIDGLYSFGVSVYLGNIGAAHNQYLFSIFVDGTTQYMMSQGNPANERSGGSNQLTRRGILNVELIAGQTVFMQVEVDGSTKTVSINDGTNPTSFFGYLVGTTTGATGVTSLQGLTGNLGLISDGSVSFNNVGTDINVSVGQYIQVSGTSQAMSANKSYICMNSSDTTLSLPTTCPVGSFIEIAGYGGTAGLFTISQAAGQMIFFGPTNTTLGATGTLSVDSANYLSAIKLVCVVADTWFMVVNSQGNFVLA